MNNYKVSENCNDFEALFVIGTILSISTFIMKYLIIYIEKWFINMWYNWNIIYNL